MASRGRNRPKPPQDLALAREVAPARYEDLTQQAIELLYLNGMPISGIVGETKLARFEVEARLQQVESDLVSTVETSALGIQARRARILLRSEQRSAFISKRLKTGEDANTADLLRAPDWVKIAQSEDKLQLDTLKAMESDVSSSSTSQGPGEQAPSRPRGVLGQLVQEAMGSSGTRRRVTVDVGIQTSLEQATYEGVGGLPELRQQVLNDGP